MKPLSKRALFRLVPVVLTSIALGGPTYAPDLRRTCGGAGKLVSKPDCLMNVGGFGPGSAQLTAEVTKVSGSLAAFYSVGQELEADVLDSAPDRLGVFQPRHRIACQQFGFSPYGV